MVDPLPALCNCTGALQWAYLLFSRVKQTMAKLKVAEPGGAWVQVPIGQQVRARAALHVTACMRLRGRLLLWWFVACLRAAVLHACATD